MTVATGGALAPLRQRLLFTLAALVLCRLGANVPLPGVDPQVLHAVYGGTLGHLTVFALGVMPYLAVSFWALVLGALWPRLGALNRRGGRTLDRYVRVATVAVAALQAYGIAVTLDGAHAGGQSLVIDPGPFFRFTTVVTLTGGTLLLIWLADQITARGIGNGIALVLFSGVAAGMPSELALLLELGRTGAVPVEVVLLVPSLAIAVLALITFVERSHRRILVQYRPRLIGERMFEGEGAYLRLKLNQAGIAPVLLASQFNWLPAAFASYAAASGAGWAAWVAPRLSPGQFGYFLFQAALVVGFGFLYVAAVSRPRRMAETLRSHGGFIPGHEGETGAADHLAGVLARLALIGSVYLAVVVFLPDLLTARWGLPPLFYFGGVNLLLAVCIIRDFWAQLRAELAGHAYGR